MRPWAGRMAPRLRSQEHTSELQSHRDLPSSPTRRSSDLKSQLNENGKVLALWHAFPELNHNEAVGWEDGTTAARLAVVLLREPGEDAEVARRIAATREVS